MNKKAGDQQKNRGLLFLAVALFFLSLSSFSVLAADPGHGAGVIGANDSASGNYSFPDSISVNYSTFLATSGCVR